MAQLTIYLDQTARDAVKRAAHRENVSLSKWARHTLLRAAEAPSAWPEGYRHIVGSIQDEPFSIPEDLPITPSDSISFDT